MSCFKWLELVKRVAAPKKEALDLTDFDYEDTRRIGSEGSGPEEESFLLSFTDEDVVLRDGDEVRLKSDQDLRSSMLILTYVNMSVAFLREGHYWEALESLGEAKKLNERNSLVYFRTAQALGNNLGSSYRDLRSAKQNIEKAIYLNQFEEKNEGKIYIEEAALIEAALKSKREKVKQALSGNLRIKWR